VLKAGLERKFKKPTLITKYDRKSIGIVSWIQPEIMLPKYVFSENIVGAHVHNTYAALLSLRLLSNYSDLKKRTSEAIALVLKAGALATRY